MADEGDTQFSVGDKLRLVRLAMARCYGGAAHQASEIRGAFTKGRIADRFPDHPALDHGDAGSDQNPDCRLSSNTSPARCAAA